MAKYYLTQKAVLDLSDIWEYTYDTWSGLQADKYYFMLIDTCQSLADGAINGKNYKEVDEAIFGFMVSKHIIFYRKIDSVNIEIIRILHVQMDLGRRMEEL